MSVTSGRRICPSKHSVHNSQNYSHKYCIPGCAVTVVTTVNSRMKLETCMLTKRRQFLELMAYNGYTQLFGYVESTYCINSMLILADDSIIISTFMLTYYTCQSTKSTVNLV